MKNVPDEIMLRRLSVEDALATLEQYLSDAFSAGWSSVRVVHGKGTGTLRLEVRRELARHPLVESFQLAGSGMGGWGATLVQLKPPPSDSSSGSGKGLKDEARKAKNP